MEHPANFVYQQKVNPELNQGIAVKEPKMELMTSLPTGQEADTILLWAKMMSGTKFYQSLVAAGGENAVVAVFLAARELGIPYIQAINGGLFIVQGRVFLSSQMMGMLIRKHGHSIKTVTSDETICTLQGTRKDNGDKAQSTFTMSMAEKIGLTKNQVWKNYPAVMLYNRALSILAKQLFPDAIGNASVDGESETIDITPNQQETAPNRETLLFIDRFELLDLDNHASKFINSIASNMNMTRRQAIEQCSKDPEKFKNSLDAFKKKVEERKNAESSIVVASA